MSVACERLAIEPAPAAERGVVLAPGLVLREPPRPRIEQPHARCAKSERWAGERRRGDRDERLSHRLQLERN